MSKGIIYVMTTVVPGLVKKEKQDQKTMKRECII